MDELIWKNQKASAYAAKALFLTWLENLCPFNKPALAFGTGYLYPSLSLRNPYPLAAHRAAVDLEHIVIIYLAVSVSVRGGSAAWTAAFKKALDLILRLEKPLVLLSSFIDVFGEHSEIHIDYKGNAYVIENASPGKKPWEDKAEHKTNKFRPHQELVESIRTISAIHKACKSVSESHVRNSSTT